MKKSEFKNLIKEYIVRLLEGEQISDNLYLGEFEDNIVLTQKSVGDNSEQKIQISTSILPKVLDAVFNKVPIETFPIDYRKSMIAKLVDGIANSETEFSAETSKKDSKPEGPDAGEETPGMPTTPDEEAELNAPTEEPGAEAPPAEEPAPDEEEQNPPVQESFNRKKRGVAPKRFK